MVYANCGMPFKRKKRESMVLRKRNLMEDILSLGKVPGCRGGKGSLIRIDPNTLPDSSNTAAGSQITIRHGESMIFLPAGSGIGSVADLVKALNCHA